MQTVKRISKKAQSLTQRLARLREGPASMVLPGNVKEVEMSFAMRNRDYGARRFLQRDVPSLLYKNPTLSFKQNRPERIPDPTMVIRYDDGNSKSISLKAKSHESILEEFTALMSSSGAPPSASAATPSTTASPPSSSPSSSHSQSGTSPPPAGEVEAGVDVGTARE